MLKRFGFTTAALLAALAVAQPNLATAKERDDQVRVDRTVVHREPSQIRHQRERRRGEFQRERDFR